MVLAINSFHNGWQNDHFCLNKKKFMEINSIGNTSAEDNRSYRDC